MSMTRSEILAAAERCVVGDREQDYGGPERNFTRIAEFWTTYLGYPVDAKDVAAMLALLKIARIASGHAKADNWIDLAGYAACGGEIEGVDLPKAGLREIKIVDEWDEKGPDELLEVFMAVGLSIPNCYNCAHAGGACKYEDAGVLRNNCPLHKPKED